MAYQITNWNEHYEHADSRKIKGPLNWVKIVTQHDGKRYKRLTRMPEGISTFGAFILILQVAAKMPKRGLLVDAKGEQLDTQDLEDMTNFPKSAFDAAMPVLMSDRIGWIEQVGSDDDSAKTKPDHESEQVPDSLYEDDRKPSPTKKKTKKKRSTKKKADPLFDAVAECHGIKQGSKITTAAARRISPIAAELRSMGADAKDVPARFTWIVNEYPGATISALPKQWQAAGRGIETGQSARPGARRPEPNANPEDTKVKTW